jgi:hypothetical protein
VEENRPLKACPLTVEPKAMIRNPPLPRKESKFPKHSLLRLAVVVPKSVTFLLLIKKILTTQTCHIAENRRMMSFQMKTNLTIRTTRMAPGP